MKSCLNLLFIVIALMVFSVEKGFSGCHNITQEHDECHSCHGETQTKEHDSSSSNHEESDCAMACCHTVMHKIDLLSLTNLIISDFGPEFLILDGGMPLEAICDVFRPPIVLV